MTANRLSETLQFIVSLDEQLRLQTTIEQIRDQLTNLAQSPASTPHQSILATALGELAATTGKLAAAITPARANAIASMNGQEFFDPGIAQSVQSAIASNPMTPSVARDTVTDLAQRRAAFLQNVRSTLEGLRQLHIQAVPLAPGTADISFLIPRDLFDSDFEAFTKELAFISRLMQDITEGVTGERRAPSLATLSSSIPTISLESLPQVILVVGGIVKLFLDAWERIEKIRKVRDDLKELQITTPDAIEQVEEQVTTTIETIVEESTAVALKSYNGHDPGRKNELNNAIANDVRRLFGQIERGLTVEVRAEPNPQAPEEDAIAKVIDLGRTLSFPQPAREPLLLQSGEVFEGEIHKWAKKTTTTTTATKKVSKKAKDNN